MHATAAKRIPMTKRADSNEGAVPSDQDGRRVSVQVVEGTRYNDGTTPPNLTDIGDMHEQLVRSADRARQISTPRHQFLAQQFAELAALLKQYEQLSSSIQRGLRELREQGDT